MRLGFFAGSLVLIAMYVVFQPGASKKADEASGVFQQGLKRLFSPSVAGIGNHSHAAATAPPVTTGATSPATTGPYFTV